MSDLSAPLGRRKAKAAARPTARRHWPIARIATGGVLALVAAAALRILLVNDPLGGQPSAEVAIDTRIGVNPLAGMALPEAGEATIVAEPEIALAGPVHGSPSIITIGDDAGAVAARSLEEIDAPDQRGNLPELSEETGRGTIPRISSTGDTPFDAYSRPSITPANAGGKPLVAIIVTGLGLNTAGTLDAIGKLPETVTLAFAPYGNSLDRTTGVARAEGHELFLEVPLEPFDYPDNDPGPDTLLTGQNPRDNVERLYAVMGRFGGYAGLINNMGARFTASGADFGPIMEELGARGLGYLDDGSSNRSLAPQLAKANGVAFGRADLVLDGTPNRAAILDQLTVLEARARQQGYAIGVLSALPVSIETVAEWSAGLEAKGLVLVPASALMKR